MTIFNFSSLETGKWQKIYWCEGPQAALDYCYKTSDELGRTIRTLDSLQESAQDSHSLKKLQTYYVSKQERYNIDITIDQIGQKTLSRGRAEPGRTPLNHPDFRRRFNHLTALNDFIDKKIEIHQEQLVAIENLLKGFIDDTPEKQFLITIQNKHSGSLKKWKARKEAAANSPSWLLPAGKDPLDVMNIRQVHREGHLGESAKAIVVEGNGVDLKHQALTDVFLPGARQAEGENGKHGTHVCGIIAAKKNEHNGHIGAAPFSKIQLVDKLVETQGAQVIKDSDIEIVNFSGAIPNPLASLVSNFDNGILFYSNLSSSVDRLPEGVIDKLMVIAFKKDRDEARRELNDLYSEINKAAFKCLLDSLEKKLLINAIGNDGITISENPKHMLILNEMMEYIDKLQLGILVVNLLTDGVTPNPSTNFPGAKFAESAVCAIGTDALSTLPNDQYGILTGSSMAAPYVTGTALLLKAAFPKLDINQIRYCILESAIPIVLDSTATPRLVSNPQDLKNYSHDQIEFSKQFFGRGLLNAEGAFELARKLAENKEESS